MVRVPTYKEIDATRLRQAREWAGLGSRELSKMLGEAHSFVYKLETDRIKEISESLLDELAHQFAGRHLLKELQPHHLIAFFEGHLDLEHGLRPIEAPAPGADPRRIRRIEPLHKEGAPAETGTPTTPISADAGSPDQMSYCARVLFPAHEHIIRSVSPRRRPEGSSRRSGFDHAQVAKRLRSVENSLSRRCRALSPRATPIAV